LCYVINFGFIWLTYRCTTSRRTNARCMTLDAVALESVEHSEELGKRNRKGEIRNCNFLNL
jgi:hypothetical protein